MAVIAVGDFDNLSIKNLIIQHFSSIKKSEKLTHRPPVPVPDHNEALYTIASDPEAPYSYCSIIFKFDNKKNLLTHINGRDISLTKLNEGLNIHTPESDYFILNRNFFHNTIKINKTGS